jgi:hypothetical protein
LEVDRLLRGCRSSGVLFVRKASDMCGAHSCLRCSTTISPFLNAEFLLRYPLWVIHFRYRRSGSSHQADHIPRHSPGPLLPDLAVHGIIVCANYSDLVEWPILARMALRLGFVKWLCPCTDDERCRLQNHRPQYTWMRAPTDHICCRLM